MKKPSGMTLLGMGLTALGFIVNMASGVLEEKKLDAKIGEKVGEAVSKMSGKES